MSNEGGSYTIGKDGVRKRTDEPQKIPAGGGARDEHGSPIGASAPTEHNAPAMPEAPKFAPWETPPSATPAVVTPPAAPTPPEPAAPEEFSIDKTRRSR